MPSLAAVAGGQIALGCDTRIATAGQARGVKAREDSSVSPSIAASGPMVSHTLNRINDADLIREAQRGSRTAFEELVRQYDQAVLRLALHLTGSEAEAQDIYQEAFLKAYRHLGNFRFECSFYTWMYRIVTNLCLDHLRRRKSRREDPATVLDSSGDEMDLLSNVSDTRSMANPSRELDRKNMGESISQALD